MAASLRTIWKGSFVGDDLLNLAVLCKIMQVHQRTRSKQKRDREKPYASCGRARNKPSR